MIGDAQDTMTHTLANLQPAVVPIAMGLGDGLAMFEDFVMRVMFGGGAFVVFLLFSRAHMLVSANPAELRPQGQLLFIRLGMVGALAGVAASIWL